MSTAHGPSRRGAIVVPIKGFTTAKDRLSGALSGAERRDLARRLAENVLRVALTIDDCEVLVVTDDDAVFAWASELGATALRQRRSGLNGAVSDAREKVASLGCEWVLVTHADLVDATPLGTIVAGLRPGVVTLVPDRHEDGTNVLALDCGTDFDTHYGPGSFPAHLAEAARRGLEVAVVRNARLALDVDEPGDLADLDGF